MRITAKRENTYNINVVLDYQDGSKLILLWADFVTTILTSLKVNKARLVYDSSRFGPVCPRTE